MADAALLAALAGGATVTLAAEQAGIAPRTAWRRLDDPDFRAQLDTARRQTVAAAIDVLGKASTAAAATLVDLMTKDKPPSTRLGAARAILELGGKMRETAELEERIATLEAALLAQQPHTNGKRL
jgi:hypothetical protein